MSSKVKKTQTDIDWENRILCSDESCIGIIGLNGRCGECGKPYEGDLEGLPVSNDLSDAADGDVSADDNPPVPPVDEDWENRTLCSDESCIGVIGPDGRCRECGKPFSRASSE
jgi:hypothetical protein